MKINFFNFEIPNELILKKEIDDNIFLKHSVNYLDDGYELTELEEIVYKKNNLHIDKNFLNHITCCQKWFEIESENIFCDHAAILYRYSFEDYYHQIDKLRKEKKELVRFYDIKKKYGLDFYLQFLGEKKCFDIIHIENDYFNKTELLENKNKIEEFIKTTDWEHASLKILERKSEWESLAKDDQHDWKARYLGFSRAFLTKK